MGCNLSDANMVHARFRSDMGNYKLDTVMKKHPLIDPGSPYYDANGEPTIFKLERELTVCEMIGACIFNIGKYKARLGKKDDPARELEKIGRYEVYLEELLQIPMRHHMDKVSYAWAKMNITWSV